MQLLVSVTLCSWSRCQSESPLKVIFFILQTIIVTPVKSEGKWGLMAFAMNYELMHVLTFSRTYAQAQLQNNHPWTAKSLFFPEISLYL